MLLGSAATHIENCGLWYSLKSLVPSPPSHGTILETIWHELGLNIEDQYERIAKAAATDTIETAKRLAALQHSAQLGKRSQ